MIDYNKIIYVDVDDTIEDLLSAWCLYLNTKYNLYVDPNDAYDWDLRTLFTTLSRQQIHNALADKELWKLVKPIPGAQKYLKKLIEDGFEVYLCTATHVEYFKGKYDLVTLAEVDMFTTVFIGNANTKIIDDKMVTPRGYKGV